MTGSPWKSWALGLFLSLKCAWAATDVWSTVAWQNVAEIVSVAEGDYFRLARVPSSLLPQLNKAAQTRAFSPAGVELRFNLTSPQARLRLRYVEDRAPRTRGAPVNLEIWQGDFLARTVAVQPVWTEVVIAAPGNAGLLGEARGSSPGRYDSRLVRIAFPHGTEIQVQRLEGSVSKPSPDQLPKRRYLAYGSSITHGYDATRAGEAYPAQLGRLLGADVINLGFGAGAFLEPTMADWIAQRDDWDFATLELGVNLVSRTPPDEFRKRVRYFLGAIARARPERWVFVVDLFPSFRDLQSHPSLPEYRRIVQEEVERLRAPRVRHVPALSLLSDYRLLGSDLLHPAPEGFAEIARNLADFISSRVPELTSLKTTQ